VKECFGKGFGHRRGRKAPDKAKAVPSRGTTATTSTCIPEVGIIDLDPSPQHEDFLLPSHAQVEAEVGRRSGFSVLQTPEFKLSKANQEVYLAKKRS
jgi:hypothetical protein